MNKKYLTFGLLGLFAMALVSAGLINYYGSVEQEIVIQSPIVFNEQTTGISGFATGFQLGEEMIVQNVAPFAVDVRLESVAKEGDIITDDITTSYVGTLVLSSKDDCYADGTCTLDDTTTATVFYTVVGNNFDYIVESDDVNVEDYTLVYYPNEGADYTDSSYTGNVIPVDAIITSLPLSVEQDLNAEGDEYCDNGLNPVGSHCNGAKLWLVPNANLNAERTHIDVWDGNVVLFETDLIYYFKTTDGNTVIPKGVSMEFVPMYEFGTIEGDYTVITTVSPVVA